MAGTLVSSTLSDGTNSTSTTNAIQGSAKAWVNFNGTTSPGTIRASYNVSSIVQVSTAVYTLNFANALTDANYSVVADTSPSYGNSYAGAVQLFSNSTQTEQVPTSSAFTFWIANGNASSTGMKYVCISVFR